ncbi:MAG: hypothetical protein RR063_09475 [Anaerovoracaceae bacterium]
MKSCRRITKCSNCRMLEVNLLTSSEKAVVYNAGEGLLAYPKGYTINSILFAGKNIWDKP